jgi:hypothetical protein
MILKEGDFVPKSAGELPLDSGALPPEFYPAC